MNIIFEKKTKDYIIKFAEFSEEPEILFEKIKKYLDDKELEYFYSVKSKKRKREWCGTRLLLKNISGFYSKINYDEFGNPYLDDRNRNISVTHTSDFVGIIVSKNKETGIDAEIISEKILKTASKFITENELKHLTEKEEIYLHWCGKEVLFKIKGNGGWDFKSDFKILPFKLSEKGTLNAEILKEKKETYQLDYNFINHKNLKLLIVSKG